MQSFVNREAELDRLRECYDSPRGELIVVYGRRRMGKTELIRHSLAGRDNVVHFQATETTKRLQLEDFVARAAETFPDIVNVRPDWEPLIQHLAQQGAIIVLDEFPYLVQAYPRSPRSCSDFGTSRSSTPRRHSYSLGHQSG